MFLSVFDFLAAKVSVEDLFVAFEHDTKGYFTDGIHFNARGQERVWERLKYRLTMEGIQPEKMQLDYPMGIDLREKGPEWIQLFEKSRMENYKNRNGVMSFDESPYNLGRGGAPSSSISPPSTSSATNTDGVPMSNVDNSGKVGFVMNHLSKIAIGFFAGAIVGKALSSSPSSTGEKVRVKEVKVEVPGKERIKVVKEIVKVFSFRTPNHQWDPKSQRPELWNLYNSPINKGESIRVFPLSNWTELDIWQYIYQENIPIVPLYYAKMRPVIERNKMLIMVDDDRLDIKKEEKILLKKIRFRTLGCYPLTGAIESDADTLETIVLELLKSKTSEREGRAIDNDSSSSMEKKKLEGYF